jgi:Cft2 family RNA processing exonuclease
MQLTDLNSARDIGSNSLLVELGPFRFLVDCGLHPKKVGYPALPALNRLDREPLDFFVITHSHLDHGGSLPVALRHQPSAPVLVTPATEVLLPRMLRNSCSVMMRQRDELNLSEYPLFTYAEIERLEGRLWPLPFSRPRVFEKNGHRLEVTFFPAGHVAGAAGVRFVHQHRRIFFTGDVLFADQLTLTGARFPEETFDTLVTETTRGAAPRDPSVTRVGERDRLVATIDQALANGGSALVPVFALGRMQEVFAILHAARRAGRLRDAPIYASGLGLDLVDYFDTLSRKHNTIRFRRGIMRELGVQPLRQTLVPGREPGQRGIYVVSSGMMVEHTPSYALAASLLPHPRNAVCFVGYCDPDTPGGRLLATQPGQSYLFSNLDFSTPVRARVEKFHLSGHADREELLDFAAARQPRAVVITHGDPPARAWFADALSRLPCAPKVIDPVPGETVTV